MNIQVIDQISKKGLQTPIERGQLFGDGFFTTGLIRSGKLYHSEEHFLRLEKTAKKLNFKDFSLEAVKSALNRALLSINKAVIRITVERVQLSRGYAIDNQHTIKVTLVLSSWVENPSLFCEAIIATTPISKNSFLAGMKHLNRLDNVLAASECETINQEAILCDAEHVICGSRSNLFLFHEGIWKTPQLDQSGIEGITKKRLLKLMCQRNFQYQETNISKRDFFECQAAFITNSLIGIWPISRIEGKALATKLSCALQSDLNFSR